MAKLEAKLETIVDSVGNFFSGKDQLPWCDPDIVAVKIEVATIQGVGILWRERKQKGKDVEGEGVCGPHVPAISCRSYLLQA
ncbi:mitochondrial fission 1 protein A isoform X4 [Arachis hypogaea]|uniref:mitochondrial fission 1 protein A isoform X4 n=1 Tax=Arachis hypogaea TaxID=3818 RepID=UPI003B20C69E